MEIELCECVNCKPVTISRAIAGQMVWRVYQLEMLYDILARDNRSQALAFVLDVHNDWKTRAPLAIITNISCSANVWFGSGSCLLQSDSRLLRLKVLSYPSFLFTSRAPYTTYLMHGHEFVYAYASYNPQTKRVEFPPDIINLTPSGRRHLHSAVAPSVLLNIVSLRPSHEVQGEGSEYMCGGNAACSFVRLAYANGIPKNTLRRCLSLYRNWNWLIKKIKDRFVENVSAWARDGNVELQIEWVLICFARNMLSLQGRHTHKRSYVVIYYEFCFRLTYMNSGELQADSSPQRVFFSSCWKYVCQQIQHQLQLHHCCVAVWQQTQRP